MSNIVTLQPLKVPATQELTVYRGDYFSLTLIGQNSDLTPYDFSIFDSFASQVRVGDPRNTDILFAFDASDFVLGKTDVENAEFDELHVTSTTAFNLTEFYPILWMDVEGVIGTEKYTFTKVKITVETDVTR